MKLDMLISRVWRLPGKLDVRISRVRSLPGGWMCVSLKWEGLLESLLMANLDEKRSPGGPPVFDHGGFGACFGPKK